MRFLAFAAVVLTAACRPTTGGVAEPSHSPVPSAAGLVLSHDGLGPLTKDAWQQDLSALLPGYEVTPGGRMADCKASPGYTGTEEWGAYFCEHSVARAGQELALVRVFPTYGASIAVLSPEIRVDGGAQVGSDWTTLTGLGANDEDWEANYGCCKGFIEGLVVGPFMYVPTVSGDYGNDAGAGARVQAVLLWLKDRESERSSATSAAAGFSGPPPPPPPRSAAAGGRPPPPPPPKSGTSSSGKTISCDEHRAKLEEAFAWVAERDPDLESDSFTKVKQQWDGYAARCLLSQPMKAGDACVDLLPTTLPGYMQEWGCSAGLACAAFGVSIQDVGEDGEAMSTEEIEHHCVPARCCPADCGGRDRCPKGCDLGKGGYTCE